MLPKNPVSHLFSILLMIVFTLAQATPTLAAPGDTIRVSMASGGTQGNSGSYYQSISADGRYVAFTSFSSNLVSGDTNGVDDVFVRDTVAKTTTRVSVASNGAQGNGRSDIPSISADGRYVTFHSDATNLVDGAMGGVFLRDTSTNTTVLISVDVDGNPSNGNYPSISANGRYVIFASYASNLVNDDTNWCWDVFVRDTVANTTTRVSVDSNGVEGDNHSGNYSSISADGRYVSFTSLASNLAGLDTNGTWDVFVHDTWLNTTTRVSVDSLDTEGNNRSDYSSISGDGHYVAFWSLANNLVSGDTNGWEDVFIHDNVSNTTTRVSVNSNGTQGNSGSGIPSISADGRYVAFDSAASNLVSGDTNGFGDSFVRDTASNVTTRVSVDSNGMEGNGNSGLVSISGDGRYVAFESAANNLISGDTNGYPDVFMHDTSIAPTLYSSVKSVAANDGWILEASETSDTGGTLDATSTTVRLGDDAAKKQYRAILSFSTAGLPDNAVITKVTLKVKQQGIVGGGNPLTAFQGFMVDIKRGTFGAPALQAGDFQAPLGAAGKTYGPFKPALVDGWYSINLTAGKAYINKSTTASGLTQLRLRFKLDDNNNAVANYLSLYSGNIIPIANRPQLNIEYYVP
jgi:hypothetical protein